MLNPFCFEVSDDVVGVTAGASKVTYHVPLPLRFVEVFASLTEPQATGNSITIDINKDGVSVLGGAIEIPNGASFSVPVSVSAQFDRAQKLTIDVDRIGDGTGKGLKVHVLAYQTIGTTPAPPPPGEDPPPDPPQPPQEVLVDRTTGSAYGNMTVFGLSNAFNGAKNVIGSLCAAKSGGAGYVGQSFPSGKVFSKAILHGANDRGFLDGSNGPCTITVYAKNGLPSGQTDGIVLGSITFNDTLDESAGREIVLNTTTGYSYAHAYINGGAFSTYCAELVLFERV